MRTNRFKRALLNRLPKRFRHEDKLEILDRKMDALARHMGVTEWDAHYEQVSKSQGVTGGLKNNSKHTWAMRVLARIIGASTFQTELSNHFKTKKGNIQMKKFTSRKFLMAVVAGALIIANDGLSLNLDTTTITAFCSIVVGYIVGEAATDVAKVRANKEDVNTGDTWPAE